MFIDIHRHSSDNGAADVVLRNLFPSEVNQINNKKYYSVGLHPWHTNNPNLDAELEVVANYSHNQNVIAIGETGIDKSIDTDIAIQSHAFNVQIEIAKAVDKPMIIHCVRAYDDMLRIKKKSAHHQPWIIHWFNASPEMALDLIRKGCYLSFGIALFKANTKAFRSFSQIPVENIFLETDDANLTIRDVYDKAAQNKGITLDDLQKQLSENFTNCFGII
jgi:TatD DNase family protein